MEFKVTANTIIGNPASRYLSQFIRDCFTSEKEEVKKMLQKKKPLKNKKGDIMPPFCIRYDRELSFKDCF
ncbi:hypothetical protein GCM10007103_03820 [Salinimicrobium marinum]|uniref:Uncharacterized protein n=1 Tax=Salinimicrobium marinum TaxID=680283 RepID=A0A918S6D2_9FLAO|nr:hypothetical protein [Salinimicrobium marinum]GHA25803.1 hypothetical protein GCM10007103_03820 [Salinimicrobium marinum]